MIKKSLILCLVFLCIITALPINVKAETLQDYINFLEKYKKDAANNQSNINKTDNEIKQIKIEINDIKNEVIKMGKEIEKLRQEIVKYNEEIKDKSLKTKQLFEYFQLSSGENAYLEYAFGADSITDLIYRVSMVEQLSEYNNNVIKELEEMIVKNNEREKELNKKDKELGARQVVLNNKVKALGEQQAQLNQVGMTVQGQIKIYQEIVDRYKSLGCSASDVIGRDCAVSVSAGEFVRPIEKGYTTSEFGYRWGVLHQGLDMSNSNPFNTKIYPVANGRVIAKYVDYYGALVVAVEHYVPAQNKYYTSLYAHFSAYAPNIYVGKVVTKADYLGYMGETGFAYGPHLHLEITDCRLFNPYDNNCYSWTAYEKYMIKKVANGYKGPREYIYFPNTWYAR
ncbi:MAG: peptidoglycan DD-metalloendopeptidase family protein [Bacilli bacterium]